MTFYRILISILTSLIVGVLFCISFIALGIAELSVAFLVETGIILVLSCVVRIMWFYDGQRQALASEQVVKAKNGLNTALQKVTDTDDFDLFCETLSEQNRQHYIYSKVGTLTERNFEPNIFEKIYMKLHKSSKGDMLERRRAKAERKSNKKKFIIRSSAILAGTEIEYISVKNYAKGHNAKFFITTVISGAASSIAFAMINPTTSVFSWATLWRFLMWLVNIIMALAFGWYKGRVMTADEYISYYARSNDVVQRYIQRKTNHPEQPKVHLPEPVVNQPVADTYQPVQISLFDIAPQKSEV